MNNPAATKRRIPSPRAVYHVRYAYLHHCAKSGYHRLTDFTGEPVELSPTMRILGETVLRLPGKLFSWYGGHFEYSRHDFTMEIQIFRHMCQRRNVIYHFLYGEKSFFLLARTSGFRGHRFIATLHHPQEHYSWLFRNTRHLSRLDHAIVLSRRSIEFTEHLVGPGRVSFIPYGVDTEYFCPAKPPETGELLRCVFIGYHMRDFDTLRSVVERVQSSRNNVAFDLVSANPKCEPMAKLPRVRWLRKIPDSEYLRVLQNADLLVQPMHNSVANTSVLEAMAVGLPVVVTQGGIEDYLDPSFSIVTPVHDRDAMTTAVLDLLSDIRRLAAMRKQAREHAMKFDWREIARQVEELYRKLS